MRTPNLPVRYEIDKTAGILTHELQAICAAVMSEGGIDEMPGANFSASATTGRTVATRRALLSIRPKATLNGLVTRALIEPADYCTIATGTNIITLIELVYNPTFQTSSGSLTWTSAGTSSAVEYSIHGDANAGVFTGGTVVQSYLLAGSTTQRNAQLSRIARTYPLVLDQAGANPRALSVVATDVSGTATVYATMGWKEVK
jgi:hypothetical protein